MSLRPTTRRVRGFALLLVLFALSTTVVVVLNLQRSAFRQASAGRESLARVRAYWAARAGLEVSIARLGNATQNPDPLSAFDALDQMTEGAVGNLDGASWEIVHEANRDERDGPADPHAKININLMTFDDLMLLPGMTEDVADAILDWIDEDDIVNGLGAEEGYYSQLASPYGPRNGPIHSLLEVELIAGADPYYVRGEDWNLNGRLDPNEDDGDISWPPDNSDGALDGGWSALVTTESVEGGLSETGVERINLRVATPEELIGRFSWMVPSQAEVILSQAAGEEARLEDFINNSLRQLAQAQGLNPDTVQNLTIDQIGELLGESTMIGVEDGPVPGRLNINTCTRETLDYLAAFTDTVGASLADSLIFARDSRGLGFTRLIDLTEVPQIGRNLTRLAQLSQFIDVKSGSFLVTSRGRDDQTGIEVEIVTTVDRRTLPIVLTDVMVR